jgi:hypothetical protein
LGILCQRFSVKQSDRSERRDWTEKGWTGTFELDI